MAIYNIQFNIPDNQDANFQAWFLAARPNVERRGDGTTYTLLQWFKEVMRRDLAGIIQNGKTILRNQANPDAFDDTIIS